MNDAQKVKEYNAFGPWIYEINEEHALPALFEGHISPEEPSLLLIKIPIDAERRNLKPGMNMYNYVIGLYGDHLRVLRKETEGISNEKIGYGSIQAIEHSINLLRGELTIFTDRQKFSIIYNSSSEPVIHRLISIIREKISGEKESEEINRHPEIKDDFCFLYGTILQGMKKREKRFITAGHQEEINVKFRNRSILKRISEIIFRPYLPGSLHLINSKELIIIRKDCNNLFRRYSNHSYSYLYLPISGICNIKKYDSSDFMHVSNYEITAGNNEFIITSSGVSGNLGYLEKFGL